MKFITNSHISTLYLSAKRFLFAGKKITLSLAKQINYSLEAVRLQTIISILNQSSTLDFPSNGKSPKTAFTKAASVFGVHEYAFMYGIFEFL